MVTCSILGCKGNSARKDDGISFHMFPKEQQTLKKWIEATGRTNWEPNKNSRLCSAHFEEGCFNRTKKITYLNPLACPTKSIHNMNVLKRNMIPSNEDNIDMTASQAKKIMLISTTTNDTLEGLEIQKLKIENKKLKSENQELENKNRYIATAAGRNITRKKEEIEKLQLENRTLEYKVEKEKTRSAKRLRQLKTVRESRRRLIKKVATIGNILTELKCKGLINNEESEVLTNIETENKDFLRRYLNREKCTNDYSSALRKFALCLNFISPKAYNYIRKQFDSCLPHPKTLYNWYKSVNCEPGFTQESFDAIKTLVNKSSKKVVCGLIMDEMSIRQHLQYDGTKTVGYVNVGDHLDTDSAQIAKDALVLMVSAINGAWKIPVGYFLTNGVTSVQRSSLVTTCVNLLEKCGVVVASLTFDGCPSNFAMAKLLGAAIDDINNLETTIKISNQNIDIFPDPSHMVKLVRNTLADKKHITNSVGQTISWEHIQKLHDLQESEGLHLANKLRKSHIDFRKQIMKVRLATQTFSKSVAEALLFCEELNIPEFENAGATAEFLMYFNNIFDILNSRKLCSYGYKKPISGQNYHSMEEIIDRFATYVVGLKINGVPILNSARKTGFLGLLLCTKSLKNIFSRLVNVPDAPLTYLCTYKMSQDHLEIFFGSIRSKGGFNNNPTVLQFRSAYRRLLIHGEIKFLNGSGNCIQGGRNN